MSDSTTRSSEPAVRREGAIIGVYFQRLTELLDETPNSQKVASAFTQEMTSECFIPTLKTMTEMERLDGEMRSALDEFSGRVQFITKYVTLEHLCMSMKLYIISLHTMLDLVYRLINTVFDLGIADRDVRQRLVLNNKHVSLTEVPKIVRKYEEDVGMAEIRRQRNDVVHRGQLPDQELAELVNKRNRLESSRFSFLEKSRISESEYKEKKAELQSQLAALARQKQEKWNTIHIRTLAMIGEIASELAVATIKRCEKAIKQ